jgi:hypothetical protein
MDVFVAVVAVILRRVAVSVEVVWCIWSGIGGRLAGVCGIERLVSTARENPSEHQQNHRSHPDSMWNPIVTRIRVAGWTGHN